jgi:hypothetical protein
MRSGLAIPILIATSLFAVPAFSFVKGDANCDGSIGAADVAAGAASSGHTIGRMA